MAETKTYIGDGIYAEIEGGWTIRVTISDGIHITNTIYFEPELLERLAEFASLHFKLNFPRGEE